MLYWFSRHVIILLSTFKCTKRKLMLNLIISKTLATYHKTSPKILKVVHNKTLRGKESRIIVRIVIMKTFMRVQKLSTLDGRWFIK